jgi:hypothetical protein
VAETVCVVSSVDVGPVIVMVVPAKVFVVVTVIDVVNTVVETGPETVVGEQE